MHRFLLAFLIAILAVPKAMAGTMSCGAETSCPVSGGLYRIEMPKEKPVGVYVFFHGYKATSATQMQNQDLVKTVLAHHLAFAALEGVNGSWSIPNGPEKARDDQAYVDAVLLDLQSRFGFTKKNRVLGGFSLGASMAWYTACAKGNEFAAMLTFSGVFWNPLPDPESCVKALPKMIHVHGRADRTFPLSGRAIGTHFHQGDTFGSMAIYRNRASCLMDGLETRSMGRLTCNVASGCNRGESLLCLHDTGHQVNPADLDQALTELGFPR